MKNILLITNGFPFGETEHSYLYAEFLELCKHFRVSVLAIKPETKEIKYPIPNTVRIYTMPLVHRNIFKIMWQFTHNKVREEVKNAIADQESVKMIIRCLLKAPLDSFYANEYLKKIQEIVIKDHINCIYTYWCNQATLAAVYIKNIKEKNGEKNFKVITRFHGFDLYIERQPERWQYYRECVTKYTDRLIFACEFGKEYFQKHWPVDKKKLQVSVLGSIDFGEFNPRYCDEISIVSCSNLVPLKRVDLIAKGISLLDDNIKVKWTHIGDGVLKHDLEDLCEELFKNRTNVEWNLLGYVENDQIKQIYQNIDAQLFITASSSEGGIPISIQEAFSAGIPVIGTAIDGIPEIILDNENGFLLPKNPTPDDIALKICQFYSLSHKEKENMRHNARNRWENKGNAKKNAKAFVGLLSEIIK